MVSRKPRHETRRRHENPSRSQSGSRKHDARQRATASPAGLSWFEPADAAVFRYERIFRYGGFS